MTIYVHQVQTGPDSQNARSEYSALDDRYRHMALVGQTSTPLAPRPGVIWSPGALEVTAQDTPNRTVRVGPGNALIATTAGDGGLYPFANDSSENVNINAAGTTNDRLDLIVAKVYDGDAGSTEGDGYGDILYVPGTPSSSPVVPSVPADGGYEPLAMISMEANQTTVTDDDITDLRRFTAASGGVLYAPDENYLTDLVATFPDPLSMPVPGQLVWLASRNMLVAWNGTDWQDAAAHRRPTQAWKLANGSPGSVPSGALMYVYPGTLAASTNSAAVLSLPLPFTGGVASITVTPGDNVADLSQLTIAYSASTISGVVVQCRNPAGAGIADTNIRVNYLAVGWD